MPMIVLWFRWIALLASLFFVVPAAAGEGLALRKMKRVNGGWEVVLSLSRMANYSVFTLKAPHRVVIDVLDENMWPKQCTVKRKPVLRCRMGRLDGHQARFVLDVSKRMEIQTAALSERKGVYELKVVFAAAVAGEKALVREITPMPLRKAKRKKQRVIILDPGHGGGLDVGASFGGVDEKDLVLVYAILLKARLEALPNVRVYLTRSKDIHLPLSQRVWMARAHRADMLISIHADWSVNPKVNGVAVYSLSNYSADKYARRFIEDSNPALIGGEELQQGIDKAHDILFDLIQRESLGKSIALSRHILRQVRQWTSVLDQPHRFADFRMLSAPDLPAVLVEVGFLSNKEDRDRMQSKKWRAQFTENVTKAIKNYFKQLDVAYLAKNAQNR